MYKISYLFLFLFCLFVAGCTGITNQELSHALTTNSTASNTYADTAARRASMAVYECAVTQDRAMQAVPYCSASHGHSPLCLIVETWTAYCVVTRNVRGEEVLVNPNPGAYAAMRDVYDELQREHLRNHSSENNDNLTEQIESENFYRTPE